MDDSVDELQQTLKFIEMFYCVLGTLIKPYEIIIKRITLKIETKTVNSLTRTFEESIHKLGWYFWSFIFQVKSVSSIEIKLQNMETFLNPISFMKLLK